MGHFRDCACLARSLVCLVVSAGCQFRVERGAMEGLQDVLDTGGTPTVEGVVAALSHVASEVIRKSNVPTAPTEASSPDFSTVAPPVQVRMRLMECMHECMRSACGADQRVWNTAAGAAGRLLSTIRRSPAAGATMGCAILGSCGACARLRPALIS